MPKGPKARPLTAGMLFEGIGGFGLAAHLAGIKTIWSCEQNEDCRQVLSVRFPDVPIYEDVRSLHIARLPQGRAGKYLTEEQVGESIRLYQLGLSCEDIAEYFGVSRQALWERLKRRGVKMRPRERFGEDNAFYRGTSADEHAQNVVEKAIASGRLVPPDACEKCGGGKEFKDGRRGIQAPDYNKPLDVMWLCQPCHHAWHQENRAVPVKENSNAQGPEDSQGGDANGKPRTIVPPVDVLCGGFP